MIESKRINDQISYRNKKQVQQDFTGKDLRRSNCYNCDFTKGQFNHVSFRGAQFKACTFNETTFDSAEVIAANLKNSQFKNAKFINTVFDHVNLEKVDFEGATFENVIFVETDLSGALNMNLENQDVQVFDARPAIEISERLEKAVKSAMNNAYIKYARVLDTKEGKVNAVSMMRLLEKFDEEALIKGMGILKKNIKADFATLSVVMGLLENYKAEGLL